MSVFPAFAAIDFETANYRRDSACAVGVAGVAYTPQARAHELSYDAAGGV
ncbi:hypothetical protein [Desulfurivibrio dismutans]|nr:hypothetical protein [Desulfurivibrio alkaliphilus]MDF1614860.1 hypothetical protein [Desulfurivibrio alkaliphilus]